MEISELFFQYPQFRKEKQANRNRTLASIVLMFRNISSNELYLIFYRLKRDRARHVVMALVT